MYQPGGGGGRHEAIGAVAATSRGETTAAGPTEGAWNNLGSPTTFAYEAFTYFFTRNNSTGNMLIDIGISDGGTNRFVLVENLSIPYKLTSGHTAQFYLPVHVPAGAQLAVRGHVSGASNVDFDSVIVGHSAGVGGTPGFSRAIPLFAANVNEYGIVIDPGGTANTKGAWAQMIASTPAHVAAISGVIGFAGDTSRAAVASALIDVGVGAAGVEQTIYPNFGVCWGATRDGPANVVRIPAFACNIPSGSRIAARAQCEINTAGDRTFDLCLYGFVP